MEEVVILWAFDGVLLLVAEGVLLLQPRDEREDVCRPGDTVGEWSREEGQELEEEGRK